MKKTLKILTLLLAFVMMLQTASLLSFASSDAQEAEYMSLDAHLGAADDKTLAMQLYEALKSIEEKTDTFINILDGLHTYAQNLAGGET